MRRTGAAPSRRGSLSQNGPLVAAPRAPSSKPRLSFLARVDEANEDDNRTARPGVDYPGEYDLRSPATSSHGMFSSDEEIENFQQQPQKRRVSTATKVDDYNRRAAETAMRRLSTRSATRIPLQNVARETYRGRHMSRDVLGQSIDTTLDAKKQKKLIALFYWRRRALETYLSAWKWVVFGSSRREMQRHQQRELMLLHPYEPVSVQPLIAIDSAPRHQSALLRNTIHRQARRESAVSIGGQSNHRERMNALRDEYRRLRATAVELQTQGEPRTEDVEPFDEALAKRSAFKERLRVSYRCFDAWHEYVSECHEERGRREERAWQLYRKHQLHRCFRSWSNSFLAIRRNKKRRWLRACEFSRKWTKRRRFRQWKQWHACNQLIHQRSTEISKLRLACSVLRWREWVKRTDRLRLAHVRRRRSVLKRYLSRLKAYRKHRRDKQLVSVRAVTMSERQSLRRVWALWHRAVFAEDIERLQALTLVLSHKSAVTKWKRFVARRRERHVRARQADCVLYEGLLRRFWRRWMCYLTLRSQKRAENNRMVLHWASYHRRIFIRALLAHRCATKYDRSRAKGADDFYCHRLVVECMTKWRAHSCLQRRSRQLLVARIKRKYVLCFVAWRQYSKKLRRLCGRQAALSSQNRATVLQRAMRVWWYQFKVLTAVRILDSRYANRLLTKHLRLWIDLTLRRRHWNTTIQHCCDKRRSAKRQRIFIAWHRAAVGSRCRRRLVCLFQKKHLCKKLRGCLRLLYLHAKRQHLQRVIESRRLQSAWHSWVTFQSDQQRRSEATALADQFYSVRRYAPAVNMWKHNARRSICVRRSNTVAIRHLVHRLMKRSLHAWYKRVQDRTRRRAYIESQIIKRQRFALRAYFTGWIRAARVLCHQRHEFHRLRSCAMVRRRERAFFAWCAYISVKNARRHVVQDAQQTIANLRGRAILRGWRVTASRIRRRRVAADVVYSQRRNRLLRTRLLTWRIVAGEMHVDRMNNVKAANFHREFLLLWAFYGWQHASVVRQVIREKQRRADDAVTRKQLERAVSMWKRKLVLRNERKTRLLQAKQFYQKRQRLKGVKVWCAFAGHRQEIRSEIKRALAFATQKLNRRTFRSWLQYTSGTRAFKLKLRVIFQTGEDSIQRRAFRCWRRYRRTETLEQRAHRWRQKSLLQVVWRHWRQQVMFSSKMRVNVLITNRLLQNNASRATFTRWVTFVKAHQHTASALARADSHHKVRCFRLAIKRFGVAVQHAHAVELSASFHSTHAQRQHFMNWRRGAEAQKTRREQKAFISQRAKKNRLKQAFTGWKQLVHAKLQLLLLRAGRLGDSLALRHTWKAWKRVVFCRRLADNFRMKQVHHHLLISFREWIHYVRDQQQIRRHVEAAVAHVDRVTLQKIWEKWLGFLVERHELHRREAVASKFYSTRILQNRNFRAWWELTAYRRDRHARQLKADSFCLMTSLRQCFGHWEAYVLHRHTRTASKVVENEAIQKFVMSRAISTWHNRATTLRSLSDAASRATKFFIQRRETRAIRQLLEHATTKKDTRRICSEAIAYRSRQLRVQVFTRWNRFLVWRRRHRHVLRLFRSNQLGDYFSLWFKYVARNTRKRTLQAVATRGYREIAQRGAFNQWRQRCHHWHDRRRAVRWHRERLGRCILDVWRHRVCVLRKMRHMFRFQDSYRLETHFHSWKRYWWRKKQQITRVHDAVVWFKRQRQAKFFALWGQWMDTKREEKATLHKAIGFRTRFFSRKYLQAWHSVVARNQRMAWLTKQAQLQTQQKRYQQVFEKLHAHAQLRMRLSGVTLVLSEVLVDMKVKRAVNRWRQRLQETRRTRAIESTAAHHHNNRLVLTFWNHLQQWHALCRVKRDKLKRAQRYCERRTCGRALLAWVFHMRDQRRLHTGLQRFKDRYFRGVTDDCFLRWASFVKLKRRLRLLKCGVERSHQRRALVAWHHTTCKARKRQLAVDAMKTRRDRRLLSRCLVHWESVATERWMYTRLVHAAARRRERNTRAEVIQRWSALLPLRRARTAWREHCRMKHQHVLVGMLREWRRQTLENEDDGSE